jgi:hypothetical protein
MLPMRIMRAEGRFRAALRPMGKPTYDPRAVLVSRCRQLLRRGAIASGPRRVVPQDRRPWSGRSPRSLSITRPPPASKSHPCDAEAEPLNLSGVVRQPCTFNVAASQDRVDGTVTGVAPFGSAVRTPGPRFQAPCQNRRHLPDLAKVRIMLKRRVASSSSNGGACGSPGAGGKFFAASV